MYVYVYVYGWNGWMEWMFRVGVPREGGNCRLLDLTRGEDFFLVGGDDGGDSYMGRCGIWYMVYGIWWN